MPVIVRPAVEGAYGKVHPSTLTGISIHIQSKVSIGATNQVRNEVRWAVHWPIWQEIFEPSGGP